MKECSRCKQTQPLGNFYRRKERRGGWGVQSWCKDCTREAKREWDAQNPDKVRAMNKKARTRARYGHDALVRHDLLWEAQQGRCAICGREGRAGTLEIDHCHETGVIRGLLCGTCNTTLGWLGDNEAGVRRFLAYLTDPPAAALPDTVEVPRRWATHFEACIECGTTATHHGGGGRCRNCYMRHSRAEGKPWAQETRVWAERQA